MGRITTNVGLISGLNIKEIVDQLIDVAAIPRDTSNARTKDLQNQQTRHRFALGQAAEHSV